MIQSNLIYLLISFILILVILVILDLILIKKFRDSLTLISLIDDIVENDPINNKVLNQIIKIRRDLNKCVLKSGLGKQKFLISKDIYSTNKFTVFLELLRKMGYELSTELYYGSHYLLIVYWDRDKYVQKAK